jgi:dynein light intermediate chain 2
MQKYDEYLAKRREENTAHEDNKAITISPLNIVIIGCKYDLYEKYETENRKWLSRTMRYLAHANNASLLFCSSKVSTIGVQMRANLMDLMFEEKTKIVSQRDHLKPIFIARNQDNLNHIGVPSSGSLSGL